MKNVIVKKFKEKELATIMWKGQRVWIAEQIAELAEQTDENVSVSQYLKNDDYLEHGIDYDILEGNELKEFESLVYETEITNNMNSTTILYESGLWVYLKSLGTENEKAIKRWFNNELFPIIRQTNTSAMKTALDSVKTFNALIDETGLNSQLKLETAIEIFKNIGIDIPIEVPPSKAKNRSRENKVTYSIYFQEINQMLRDGFSYEEISRILNERGENISKSTIGRYAQEFFKKRESNAIKSEVSHDA